MSELTNKFSDLTNRYTGVAGTLVKTEDTLKATKEEVAKRDAKIAGLEQQNRDLDLRALELGGAITNLTTQISVTQGKLARSEGDRAILEKELRRLMAEKAELERQFNDLAVLRAQVHKLKRKLNIARRLEWIREGLFASDGAKGRAKAHARSVRSHESEQHQPFDLNVEVNADGSV